MKFILGLLIAICCVSISFAEAINLSFQDCLNIAADQSPSALIAKQELEMSHWQYESYRSELFPQVSLNGTVPSYSRSIEQVTIDSTIGFLTRNYSSSDLNLSINQNIPFTGGSVFLSSSLNRIDWYSPEHTYSWKASPLEVGIYQPIFQYNPQKWQGLIEPLKHELAKKQYLVSMEAVSLDACRRFFDLYIAEMELANAQFNVAVNDTIYTISKGRYQVGKIAENDLLRTELAVMNSQTALSQSQLDLDQARRNLQISLGMHCSDLITISLNQDLGEVEILLDELIQLTRKNNPNYLDYELQMIQADRAVTIARSEHWLDINVRASFGYDKTSMDFDDLYNDPLEQQENISLSFDMPLTRKGSKSDLLRARADLERTRISTANNRRIFEQQIEYQLNEFELLKRQLEIAAKSDTIAVLQFKVAKNRYLIGKIDITNLFNAQREKDTASRAYYQTLKNYWIKYYQLRQLALYDFRNRQPLIISSK